MKFIEAMNFRHACRLFDSTKKIDEETKKLIIEFGRLSPSSTGLEPWHFVVISDEKLRERMKPACANQMQITSSCFVVVYLSFLPWHFERESEFLNQRIGRRHFDSEKHKAVIENAISYLIDKDASEWTRRQTYIPLANMMTGAASLGVDSCPMEGFNPKLLKEVLDFYIDFKKYDIAVLCAFGYRKQESSKKIRESLESIATFI